jgi:multimeric flavodoxin WrbA
MQPAGCAAPAMKTLLIVYHSMTGGTQQMAQAAAAGAAGETALQVRLLRAPDAGAEDLINADGYVFATPENLAAISGLLKDFFDRTYYAVLERLNGRPYASLICAGSDGHNAARQIERIASGWRLKPVAPPLILCTRAQSPEEILRPKQIGPEGLRACGEIGAAMAAGLVLGVF